MQLEFDRELFSRVWKRVEGGGGHRSSPQDAAASALRRFMDAEAEKLSLWRRLYRVTGSAAGKRLFSQLYNEDTRHLKRLQTAYFMKTGKSYAPPAGKTAVLSPLEAVRKGHAAAQKAQNAYLDAAESSGAPCSKELLRSLAQEEAGHVRRLEAFIEGML